MRLRALAPAKINLGLFVGPTRADGRHELVTLFESISLADELLLETLGRAAPADEVHCPGVGEPNLVTRALDELRARGWPGPRVRIDVDKRIPIAAGLGGGSADAACVLRMASELAPGRPEEVMELAAGLGADVPSQIVPGLALGTGAGDLVEPFASLAEHGILVLPLAHELSTAAVYREADRLGEGHSAAELSDRHAAYLDTLAPGARLPDPLMVNDLQAAAISLCPAIAAGLEAARAGGADEALLSGSGPTVAGLFWGPDGADRAAAAAESLRVKFPDAASAVPVSAEFAMPLVA